MSTKRVDRVIKRLITNTAESRNKNKALHGNCQVINTAKNNTVIKTVKIEDNSSQTNQHIFVNAPNLRLGYVNAQSCRTKTEEIKDLIEEKDIDIMFVVETWLKPGRDNSFITDMAPPGYVINSLPRLNRGGGGMAILYKEHLQQYISIKSSSNKMTYEVMEVLFKYGDTSMQINCIYRTPYSKNNKNSISHFLEEFEVLMTENFIDKIHPIFIGDFNLYFDVKETYGMKRMMELMEQCSMHQLVHEPTHKHGHTLDWVIENKTSSIIKDCTVLDRLSDHHPIVLNIKSSKPPTIKRCIKSRKIKDINIENFKNDISNIKADTVLEFDKSLHSVLEEHAPLVTRQVRDRKHSPWYNTDVHTAKQKCRRAERQWAKSKLTVHKDMLRSARCLWKKAVRQAKREYYKSKLDNSYSCKQLFGFCNELLGKVKSNPFPTNIDTHSLSNKFACYFDQKIKTIRDNLDIHDTVEVFEPFIGQSLESFHEVSEDFIKSLILKAPCKNCDLDPLPTSLLIDCIDVLLPNITKIINTSLKEGFVPDSFKVALVKPLIKKSNLDKDELKNYRPVSNLPFLSKILEKVVVKQLNDHLQKNGLHEPLQSAYKADHSTETALLKVMNDCLTGCDTGHVCLLSLLDLSSAFDTIDHQILLKRLEKTFGIRNNALIWFESYLQNRKQSVVVNGVKSECYNLKYGVPQGSVLGPILFSLYMKPLSNIINQYNVNYHFYADDTQLYYIDEASKINDSILTMTNCISKIKIWMEKNRLFLNNDKTEAILLGGMGSLNKIYEKEMYVGNISIPFSDKVKDLGVYFDKSFSMNNQVNNVIRTMYMELKNISNIRYLIEANTTSHLVVRLVLSKLDYYNSLLIGTSAENKQKLQKLQNNAARLILKKRTRDHASPLLRSLHWLPVERRLQYKAATICYKCVHGTAPQYLQDLVKAYIPKRQLRSATDPTALVVPRMRLKTVGEKSFGYCAPKVWNALPQGLREAGSIDTFKKQLKTYLFNA